MAGNKEKSLERRGSGNKVTGKSGKPLLAIVEGNDIARMTAAGIKAIGGLKKIIGDHKEVLLKPNTNQRDPYPSITAPEALAAVAAECRGAGAEHIIIHEDHKFEPDLYYDPKNFPGVNIVSSDSSDIGEFVLVEYGKWQGHIDKEEALKDSTAGPFEEILKKDFVKTEVHCLRVARCLQNAPVIISMPVVKRHFAGQISSALKNHFGSVYGPHRWIAHAMMGKDRDYYDRKLAEFASAIRPELTITDARAMQAVSGPFRQEDTQIIEGINRIIITGDMVAADVVVMDLVKKYDRTFTAANEAIMRRQFEHAEDLGLGYSDLSKLEIIELKV